MTGVRGPRPLSTLTTQALDYFAKAGHAVRPSSSLVPQGDNTLLFTPFVARWNPDGSPDASFGSDGGVALEFALAPLTRFTVEELDLLHRQFMQEFIGNFARAVDFIRVGMGIKHALEA